jgi:hypothetical protein
MPLQPRDHRAFATPALLLLISLFASGRVAAQSQPVGSFVDGERPMYLEVDQLVEGKPFHISFKNVPAGSTKQTLFFSSQVFCQDMARVHLPGCMGPDLLYGNFLEIDSNDWSGTLAAGSGGRTIQIQGYVKTPHGGRLTSMTTAHTLASDGGGGGGGVTFPLPLTTQEILPSGRAGYDRVAQPVRVGVPLPKGQILESGGVPQLTLVGGPKAGQFTTLAKWSDGSCKWVLCEYLTDLPAGTWNTSVAVDKGSGNFGGGSLASVSGTATTINTGAATVVIDSAQDDLFQSYQVDASEIFKLSAGNRPHFWDDTDAEWTWHKQAVAVRRNGPVRAEVEVDGCFTRTSSSSDPDRVYLRFYLEFVSGQSSVRATVSLRDTSLGFPAHLLFRGLTFRAQLNDSGPFDLRIPQPATNGAATTLITGSLAASDDAVANQGFCRRTDYGLATDYNSASYMGFVQRNNIDDFAIEGVCVRIGSDYYTGSSSSNWYTSQSEFSDPLFLEMNAASSGRGVLCGIEHACRTWPVEFGAGGDGRLEVSLLPHEKSSDPFDYPLTYASCETRVFYLAPEPAKAADPFKVAASFDYPVAARSEAWVYNQASPWAWHLVSPSDFDSYLSFSGMRTPGGFRSDPVRTVFRYAGGTGGGNNNWGETQRFYQWLLTGDGGAYLNSWFEACYKADKMVSTIDDGLLQDCQPVRNPTAPVTKKSYFYDGSKHTFFQVLPDWGFTRGETVLLDSATHAAETIMSPVASPNVQPYGNFVPGTFGALTNAAQSILECEPNQALEDWIHLIEFQWSHVVFQQPNDFGVDASTLGWQAPLGTPEGSAANPDAYMISWAAGKPSDKAKYGYMSQMWTDLREMAQSYATLVHYLQEKDPSDTLIGDLLARAPDIYHYAHRGLPDDYCKTTGEYYVTDVFAGDPGNSAPDPFSPPGDYLPSPNPSGYSLQAICNLLLDARVSESALSYGVELHRSMSDPTYSVMRFDPMLNEFVWRYLVHYGVIKS